MTPDASWIVTGFTPPKKGDVIYVDVIGTGARVAMVVLDAKAVSSAGQKHAPMVPAYRVFCNEVVE